MPNCGKIENKYCSCSDNMSKKSIIGTPHKLFENAFITDTYISNHGDTNIDLLSISYWPRYGCVSKRGESDRDQIVYNCIKLIQYTNWPFFIFALGHTYIIKTNHVLTFDNNISPQVQLTIYTSFHNTIYDIHGSNVSFGNNDYFHVFKKTVYIEYTIYITHCYTLLLW